jgi:hypothetical protein
MSLKSLRVKPTLPAPMIAILSFGMQPAPFGDPPAPRFSRAGEFRSLSGASCR